MKWKVFILCFIFILGAFAWYFTTPSDIRPSYIKPQITEEDYAKGKVLLDDMQEAYGGMSNWLSFQTGTYAQVADWYDDKLGIAGWDTLPQEFQMTSTLGTDDSQFTLLNGQNKGQTWGVEDWKSYQISMNGSKNFILNEKYKHKLIYKNYWFQFPFRISEAPIIAYAGEDEVNGKKYDLLFATWGSETANKEYDQYLLYLNQQTKQIEWLRFTLREKLSFIDVTAQFQDFKTINGITLPFTQKIKIGKPNKNGYAMHENHYLWIQFGDEIVNR